MTGEIFETSRETDRLWISLSARGEGNVFALLPEIFRKMLTRDALLEEFENVDVVFPSDKQWKEKIYYRLVEQQRKCDAGGQMFIAEPEEEKLHDWNIIPRDERAGCDEIIPSKIGRKRLKGEGKKITWNVSDLAKAGCLLHSPPIGTIFEDEQEMRRVYTLIYDVFRYKNVLMQALNDINFFQLFESLQSQISVVWLLFYDLYHRSFKKRETSVTNLALTLFHHAKLTTAESALWSQRVKLAAAVARLRIKYSALTLMELLPSHLRAEKLNRQSENLPVTVWINNRKFKNANDIKKQIENSMKVRMVEDYKDLGPDNFKWDRHCPLTVSFHYSMRGELAKSTLVRNHKLIVQDRAFCVGPATFWKVIEDLQLSGSVIQTHVNSPRSTAYLANLLAQNEKIKKLMAFSAGRRKDEYENYLNDLGMTNVVVYSDRLIDFGFESACMEEVVAVYATPPNSYTAVSDPIDLVCSRGGDLSMLEILTESEDTIEGRNRVTKILEEQRKTLKFAMSRPQIQIVLYETHSELDEENCDMVSSTLKEINRLAQLHHASIQGILGTQTKFEHSKEINNNNNERRQRENSGIELKFTDNLEKSKSVPDCDAVDLKNVVVPDTDLFDTPELPCLCPDEEECKMENGCYLALIKRKQVLRLDNKYMIQMAEQRGLFGSNDDTSKQKGSKQSRKKQQLLKQELKPRRSRKKMKNIEVIITSTDIWDIADNFKKIYKDEGTEMYKKLIKHIIVKEIEDGEDSESDTENFEDGVKYSRGILVRVARNKIEILMSPLFKVWCDVCFKNKQKLKKSNSNTKGTKKVLKEISSNEINISSSTCCCLQDLVPIFRQIAAGAVQGESPIQKPEIERTLDISQLIKRSLTRKSFTTQPSGTFNIRAGPIRVFDYELKLKSKCKVNKFIIDRIATQTEASKVRSLKEEHLPLCKRTYGGTSTRDFLCEYCRKRNSY